MRPRNDSQQVNKLKKLLDVIPGAADKLEVSHKGSIVVNKTDIYPSWCY